MMTIQPEQLYTVTEPSGRTIQGIKSLAPRLVDYWRARGYTVTPYKPEIPLAEVIATEIRVYLAHKDIVPKEGAVRRLAEYFAAHDLDPYEHTTLIAVVHNVW